MTRPLRLGIVGCGAVMWRQYMPVAEQLRHENLVEYTIACDVVEDRRRLVNDKFGITRFTTDYHEVVDADDVDLVLVLTSMIDHGPITRHALNAGKHVLVEKPMAVNLEEAAEIVALAKQGPGHLICAPHVLLSPTYRTMWSRVRRGDVGRVLLARGSYGHRGPPESWFYRRGGGALFDLGVYSITSLTGFLGPVRRVTAMAGVAIPRRLITSVGAIPIDHRRDGSRAGPTTEELAHGEVVEVEAEDNAHVLLDFGESVFAAITTGFTIQRYRHPAFELYGSAGTIQMLGDDWRPKGYELWRNDVSAWEVYDETHPEWHWTYGLRHLVESIHRGSTPLTSPEHAYHVLEIMIKAQESARDGQAKAIESTFTPSVLDDVNETDEAKADRLIHR